MAESNFSKNIETMLKSMDGYLHTKTVVGDPIEAGGKILLPLADVSFGIGAGALEGNSNNKGGGGMGAKISPSAILVIDDDGTRIVSLKDNDSMTKLMSMVPGLINKFLKKSDKKSDAEEADGEDAEQEK